MKSSVHFCLVGMICAGCATTGSKVPVVHHVPVDKQTGRYIYTDTVSAAQATKEDIYLRIKAWAQQYYSSRADTFAIETDDPGGRFVVRGTYFTDFPNLYVRIVFRHTLRVQFRTGVYTYVLGDFETAQYDRHAGEYRSSFEPLETSTFPKRTRQRNRLLSFIDRNARETTSSLIKAVRSGVPAEATQRVVTRPPAVSPKGSRFIGYDEKFEALANWHRFWGVTYLVGGGCLVGAGIHSMGQGQQAAAWIYFGGSLLSFSIGAWELSLSSKLAE